MTMGCRIKETMDESEEGYYILAEVVNRATSAVWTLFSKGMQRYNFLRYILHVFDNFLDIFPRNR